MPLKPPTGTTDAVERAVAEIRGMGPARPDMMTGTQIKNGVPTSRPKTLQARPRCAKCDKPVEGFAEKEGFLDRFVVFVARCHGETEVVRVEMEAIKSGGIHFGLAFVPENRLAAAPEAKRLECGCAANAQHDPKTGCL